MPRGKSESKRVPILAFAYEPVDDLPFGTVGIALDHAAGARGLLQLVPPLPALCVGEGAGHQAGSEGNVELSDVPQPRGDAAVGLGLLLELEGLRPKAHPADQERDRRGHEAREHCVAEQADHRRQEGARADRDESNEDTLLPPVLGEADVRLLLMGLVAEDHAPEGLSHLRQKVRVAVRHRVALGCQFVLYSDEDCWTCA